MVTVTWENTVKEFPNSKYVVGDNITIPDYVLGNYEHIVKNRSTFSDLYREGIYYLPDGQLPFNVVESFVTVINKVVPVKVDMTKLTATAYKRLPGHLESLDERVSRVEMLKDILADAGKELTVDLKELESQKFYEYKTDKEIVNPRGLFETVFKHSSNSFPENIVRDAFQILFKGEVFSIVEGLATSCKETYKLHESVEEISKHIVPLTETYSNPLMLEGELKRALSDVFVEQRTIPNIIGEEVSADVVAEILKEESVVLDFVGDKPSYALETSEIPFVASYNTDPVSETMQRLFNYHSGKEYPVSSFFHRKAKPDVTGEPGNRIVMFTTEYLRSYIPLNDDNRFLMSSEKVLAMVNAEMYEANNQSEKFFLEAVARQQVTYSYVEGDAVSEALFYSKDGKVPNYRLALDFIITVMSATNRIKLPASIKSKVRVTSAIVIPVAMYLKTLSNDDLDDLYKNTVTKTLSLYTNFIKFVFKSRYKPGLEDQLLIDFLLSQGKKQGD